jgi:glycosyltransferase involved in cell wall biosynthesis
MPVYSRQRMEKFNRLVKPLIFHVLHEDGAGGGPVAVRNNCDFLKEDYRQICVYGGRGSIDAYCQAQGLEGISIPLQRKWLIPAGLVSLIFLILKHSPSAVFLYGQWAGPVGAIAARLAGLKNIVYITHFPSFYTDRDFLRALRNRIVEWIPCRLSAKIVTPSEGNFAQYVLRRLAPEEKLTVIHSVISPDTRIDVQQRKTIREQYQWDDGHCHVVSVGRLTEQKKVDWLIKSWRIVQDATPSARLWIVGDGPDEKSLRELADKLNLRGVTFLGSQPNGHRFIAAADIVVMTSQYEGHAHVPLEALVEGKPIIANNVDGVRESFTDGAEGYLVPPGDISTLADRLIELIQSPEKRQIMGQRGESQARKFYPQAVMPAYTRLLDQLVPQK